MITVDFETYYDKEYSLSKLTTEAYLRDPRFEVIGLAIKRDDEPAQWYTGDKATLAKVLASYDLPNQYVIAHNAVFDGSILAWHFGIHPKYLIDTLSMARPITGLTVGGSLKALAEKFMLGEKGNEVLSALGKRRRDFTPAELAAYGEYCKNDVDLTLRLYQVLKPHSTPQEMFLIDLLLRMYTQPVLELDRAVLTAHLMNVRAAKRKLMDRLGGTGVAELMSNDKFAQQLMDLGVDPPRKVSAKTGKEAWAFAKSDLDFKALLDHPNENVQALVAARLGVKSTLEETRTQMFTEMAERGPLPVMLNYYGGHCGRASGGDKVNLQNLPRGGELRKALVAPDGHVLVASDSSQIEARMLAWLSGQDDLVQQFANGEDVYSIFATAVYGYPVSKPMKIERHVGKTCILGLGYGTGHLKLRHALKTGLIPVDMDEAETKRLVDLYRAKYPRIVALWRQCDRALEAMTSGREAIIGEGIRLTCTPDGVQLPNGMMIRYPELRRTSDGYLYTNRRQATKLYGAKMVENVCQALARIVVFGQMAQIEQSLKRLDLRDSQRDLEVSCTALS